MFAASMTCVERNSASPLKAYTIAALACLLLFAATNPLKGQSAKSPSSRAQAENVTSTASSHVARSSGQSTSESDWREEAINNSSAPVTIVEFFDYQCPFCFKTNPALADAIQSHPGKVQLVLKHLPL